MAAPAVMTSPKKRKADNAATKDAKADGAAAAEIELYSYWRSSSAWRVRIALAHKGLAYKYHAVNLLQRESHTPEYRKLNPMEQIPLLVVDGHSLAQSVAIFEYLEETRPSLPPLYPADKYLRAKTRALVEIVNSGIQPLQNQTPLNNIKAKLGEPEMQAWAKQVIGDGLKAFSEAVAETAGTYCVGNAVTAADMFLVPQLANARRFGVDLSQYPVLTRIDAALAKLPAFVAAHMDNQPDTPKTAPAAAPAAATAAAPAASAAASTAAAPAPKA